jgi:polysaccharide export outer membrane protein
VLELVACLSLAVAQAEGPPHSANTPASPPATTEAPAVGARGQDYRIGPGDVLRVTVYGYDDLRQIVVVQPEGTFVFPLIGAVPAADATPAEVERRVAGKLSKGLIQDPKVTVVVQEYRSKVVFVMGEVAHPGAYPLAGNTGIVEILARAGPLSPEAGEEVVIVRRPERGDATGGRSEREARPVDPATVGPGGQVTRVNLRDLEAGRLEANVTLQASDTVIVPEAPRVFVSGEVRNPGAFPFTPGLTVRQAVSLAGGPTPEANAGSPRIVRGAGGKARTLKVKPDAPVQPGDTVVLKARWF